MSIVYSALSGLFSAVIAFLLAFYRVILTRYFLNNSICKFVISFVIIATGIVLTILTVKTLKSQENADRMRKLKTVVIVFIAILCGQALFAIAFL